MSRTSRPRRWPRALAMGQLVVAVVVVSVLAVKGDDESGPWGSVAGVLFILAFATTGALVASRIPSNPVGWLLCLAAQAFAVGGVAVAISERAARTGWDHPGETVAAWVGSFVWMLGVGPAGTFALLLFPDGRLPSRRWRPVLWVSGAALLTTFLGLALRPGAIPDTSVANPVGIGGFPADAVTTVGLALLLGCILAACASLVVRYRAARHEQRQQLKWLAWAVPIVLAWLAASIWVESTQSGEVWVDIANALSSIGLTVVPVAIALAILRHRLYDIDLVIKRTVVYGSVTAVLVGVYLASVLLLQAAFRPVTAQSDLAVAASTLAVAALFRPIRDRVQSGVDRRFYRNRYDAVRTVEAFGQRLRNEVELTSITADLRATVREAVQPGHVSLWLRESPR